MTINNAIDNTIGNRWLMASRDLTSAEILALFVTPVSVIPGPGVNKFIEVHFWCVILFFNTTPYTAGGPLRLTYSTSASNASASINQGVLTQSFNSIAVNAILLASTVPMANISNNGISIKNESFPYSDGDGTARVLVWYSIKDVPT